MSALRRSVLAALLAAALPVAAAGAPQDAGRVRPDATPGVLSYPPTTALDLGNATMFVQADRQATLAGVQVFVPAGLAHETTADNGVAALTAECLLQTPVDTPFGRVALRDAVGRSGGSIAYEVEPQYARFYVEAQPDRLPALLGLFARALAAPAFGGAVLAAARTEVDTRITRAENDPVTVGIDMFKQSYFVGGAGLPELGTAANVAGIGTAQLRSFFSDNYVRAGTTVTAVGDVTPQITAATKSLISALGNASAAPVTTAVKPLTADARRIITHRDVGAPWLVLGFAAPSPGDPDFGPMLVVESLLANIFERSSATTLPAIERSIGTLYLYDVKPSSMVVFVNGAEIEPTSALRELLVVVGSLGEQPLRADVLARYKASAEGAFVTDSLSLSDRSWLIGNFASLGVGPDYANSVLQALAATTSADVQRVAKKYLANYTVAIVLPREQPQQQGQKQP